MALVLKDRVKESTTTTGTGTLTLLGAVAGYQAFSAIGDGNTCYYTISSLGSNQWEVGLGTYTASGTTLSRDTVLSSSAAGALVDFSAGVKDVYVVYPAEKAIFEQADGQTFINAGPLTVVGSNVTTLPALPAELGKFIGNVNSFAQVYALNQFDGTDASADFVVYNNLTTDGNNYFTDMGINSDGYNSATYPIFTPNSGYVFHDGDNMYVGTATNGKDTVIFAGGVDTNNTVATFGSDLSTELAGSLDVATTLAVTGAATFANTVTLNASPTQPLQAATKQYVDQVASAGLHIHEPVLVETTGNLTASYTQGGTTFNITDITGTDTVTTSTTHGLSLNDQIWLTGTAGNGLSANTAYFVFSIPASNQLTLSLTFGGSQITGLTNASGLTYPVRANSGVGATLTNAGAQTALTIDNVAMATTNRVMVRLQTTGEHNGVYTVTDIGSNSTNWVLTRAIDANKVDPGDPNGLGTGDYFFTLDGDLNAGDSHVLTTEPNTMIIGYTPLIYTLFSATPTFTGGTNINVSGQVISLTGTVAATNGGTGQNTTAVGDLLYGTASNTWSKLSAGAQYKSLVMGASVPEWNAVPLNQPGAVSGTLDETHGGTGNSTYVLGDTLYSSAANTLAKLSGNTTTTKKFLGQTGTGSTSAAPVWEQPAASDITGLAPSATTDTTNADNITSGTLNNARTTATASNSASTIVARDTNGSFSANLGSFVSVSGNGSGLTSLNASSIASGTVPTARLASGTANNTTFLRGDSTWAAVPSPNNGTLTMNVSGVGLTGSASFTADQAGASTFTVASNATSANGGSTIVARDASGNFSANTITATLSGSATSVSNALTLGTGLTGSSYNGSAAVTATVSYGTTAGTACQGNDSRLSDARQATNTNTQLASLGVGTAASGTSGEIRATNNITAYFSDERLKTKIGNIENALDKVKQIETMVYHPNELAVTLGYDASVVEVGVTAQSVQRVQPQVVAPAPIDDKYLTVRYERLVPLLIEAIKELEAQVAELKAK